MKCKQTVYHQNKVEKIRIQTDCCNFFSFVYLNDRIFVFSKHNLTGIIIFIKIYSLSACILFLNEDVPEKEAKITTEGDFSQPSSKRHSFAEVFLVS